MNATVSLQLTSEQQARLEALAQQRGSDTTQVAQEILGRALDYEEWFVAEVEKGIQQADRGELIAHDDVVRRLKERVNR